LGITAPGGHALPYPTGFGPNGDSGLFINNGLIGSHVLPIMSPQRLDRIVQMRALADWTESDKLKISAGYQYVGDHDNARGRADFSNNQWQAFAGYGPASNNNGIHGAALPQSLFTQSFGTADFIDGFGDSGRLPPKVLVFNAYSVLNYLQGLGNPQSQ